MASARKAPASSGGGESASQGTPRADGCDDDASDSQGTIEFLVVLMIVLGLWIWMAGQEVRPVPGIDNFFREARPAPVPSSPELPPPGAGASPPAVQ